MDVWSVHVKNTHQTPLLLRSSFVDKALSWNPRHLSYSGVEDGRAFEIRVSKRKAAALFSPSKCQPSIVRAMGKKNHGGNSSSSGNGDRFVPGGDSPKRNNSSDGNKSNIILDWREVRATLFRREQAEKAESEVRTKEGASYESKPLGQKWAHPITVPETGCVLVATEKLDGVRTFERTVILLLRSGTRHPHEGPFGVVINRPLPKKIKHMKPSNLDLATTFADCSLHFGGPLEASMFLLKAGDKSKKLPGFEEVIPGLCFGARNSLDEAAGLVRNGVLKPQDFRFFVGYAGWQLDQLREEIESDYWYVAACSSNLIYGASESSESQWEEILQLMGGRYSELSRKPKQDTQ
ncbi:uncharacterized protein LOC131162284 [Malania oleifera]|uniref:uncharacterized protein LOC131162284 n=1 Tax=Malania oleifera TaxID=397392 RepID=UPI0025AE3A44|nr:uncharacterized protein LOC131162284 [Malania oleifera]